MSSNAQIDNAVAVEWREGDRVEVQRRGCTCWSHESHWAPDGKRGTIDGSWSGHPGIEDEHHIAVNFTDRGMFVASLSFRSDELVLIRRNARGRTLPSVPPAHGGGEGEGEG